MCNLLNLIQIDLLDYLLMWIFHFMKTHEWLNKLNAFLLSVPAYQDLTLKNVSYKEVSAWNGKDIKEISQYILGVVTQSLRAANLSVHGILKHAIVCIWTLLQSLVYALYK
jgi:hypothetical protein